MSQEKPHVSQRVADLDLLRSPEAEMNEIYRLMQARQSRKAKVKPVMAARDLKTHATVEAAQRERLIDSALSFEERRAAALQRHSERTGKPLSTPEPKKKRPKPKIGKAERKVRLAANAERSKLRQEWRKTLQPEEVEARINGLRADVKAAKMERRTQIAELRRTLPPELAEAQARQVRIASYVTKPAADDSPPWD